MELNEISLPVSNKLAADYVQGIESMKSFFDYTLEDVDYLHKRKTELEGRAFPRQALVQHLLNFHKQYRVSDKTIENIHCLESNNSMVVIGGQQAGILTGPLYSIHKIITIVKKAKQYESKLNTSVVPIFWIAGEDHDFHEINHLFVRDTGVVKKNKIDQVQSEKKPVSEMEIDKEKCKAWIYDVFKSYKETAHTNDILHQIEDALVQSTSYVDFFARLIFLLFPNEGIVLVDSSHPDLRKIESPMFEQLIQKNERLSETIFDQQNDLSKLGYNRSVGVEKHQSHLFYHQNGERVLLERDGQTYYGKNNECRFTEEELLLVARDRPELMSNNVMTRPIMQDFLFPVLTFVGGHGEIAYWALLNKAFHLFNMKLPPVLPRFMVTIVSRTTQKCIEDTNVSLSDTLMNGTKAEKDRWYKEQKKWQIDREFDRAAQEIERIHQELQTYMKEINDQLHTLSLKNEVRIKEELNYLQKQAEKTIKQKYNHILSKYDLIEDALRPNGAPQERIWNVFYFVNKYGLDFVTKLAQLPFDETEQHYIVYL
jgi:bacillithiol synthase